MRVYVDVTPRDGLLAEAVADHVSTKWGALGVQLWRGGGDLEEDSARLVVGNGQSKVLDGGVIRERVDIDQSRRMDRDELFFRLDAKLGRLVRSDMAAQRRSLVQTGGGVSRRDLFLGIRHLYRVTSGLPVYVEEGCEAKYGCVKCAQSCPVSAIAIRGGAVSVDERSCKECGLCAASCPTAAIQMPWFSEESLLGLLEGIDASAPCTKSLVITCERENLPIEPWMDVEEVSDVGVLGRRQLALAAGSSLGAVMVYCPDGRCIGSEGASKAVEAVSAALQRTPPESPAPGKIVAYLEGKDMGEAIVRLHRAAWPGRPRLGHRVGGWKAYVESLNRVAPREAPAQGLGFTEATVDDTCTLCGECVSSCPHGAFGISRGELSFSPGECTGCGRCTTECPEGSIKLGPAGESARFPLSPRVVHKDAAVTCKGCGQPVGSPSFLRLVSSRAHIDFDDLRYCPNCTRELADERRAQVASVS